MSHTILPLINCPAVQENLNVVNACKNYPPEDLPFTSFLPSEVNTNGVLETLVSPGSGKIRQVQMIYTPRTSEAEVNTTLNTDCENSEDAGANSHTYEIDTTQGVHARESFNFANLAAICQRNPDYIAQRVQAMLDGLRRKMETQITNQIILLTGAFVTDQDSGIAANVKTIATKGADGKFTEDGIQEIVYSAKNSGFCYTPFVFGFSEIYKYMLKAQSVCCANSGIDFVKFMAENQAMFMPTYRVPAALAGTEGFLVIDPGSLFLLQYNKFSEGSGLSGTTDFLQMGIISDPKTGIEYNYKFYLNPCGEIANIFISTAFKVVGLPDDMYSGGDRFEGTNGVLEFKVVNP